MVKSQEKKTGCRRTVSREGKEKEGFAYNYSPPSKKPALNTNKTNSPTSALTALNVEVCIPTENTEQASSFPKARKRKTNQTYLGVRVKMPVKDMLRNIRIAKGMDPKEIQKNENKDLKGDKKRVNLNNNQTKRLKYWQTKSLEELDIIVEVLEEDLKSSTSRQSSNHPPTFSPELGNKFWAKSLPQQGHLYEPCPILPSSYVAIKKLPKTSSGEFNYYIHRRQHEMTCFPRDSRMHGSTPQKMYFSTKTNWWGSPHKTESVSPSYLPQGQWDSMTYFWNQMEREAHLLNSNFNPELHSQDERGRTLLHRTVDEGNQSLVYDVAKQMADLNKLDSKDAEGLTALHLATRKNQPLMVSDLISLGANVNERDNYGRTCIHVSAEYGYVRVLEVIKSYMTNGTYIDLEAKNVNGLSALQTASLALKSIVCDLEKSVTLSQTRVHSLHKEQMMETLKCLLQMECNLQHLS